MYSEPFRLVSHLAKGRFLPLVVCFFSGLRLEACVAVRLYFFSFVMESCQVNHALSCNTVIAVMSGVNFPVNV